ncbi:LURP-one-related/scramblase family protein [Streptococcus jiangjianxini]|uniref:LURP-one-related/scramblase family protein n=1 Tax=Streptococcus jiangjianxini TaxID=3161189 RepID=UPI0032EC1551
MTSSLNEGGTAVFALRLVDLSYFGGKPMKTFQVKQKMLSLGGKFTIADDLGIPSYQVEGSFLKIPKTFTISDIEGREVSRIEKKVISLLPQFDVKLANGNHFIIKKNFTFFKSRYQIEGLGIEVKGDVWDLSFSLQKDGHQIASIKKELWHLTSSYVVEVYDESYSDLVISLVIAIDYVKEQEAAQASSSSV